MREPKPPRDWFAQAAGAAVAILLLAGLGYAFAGPAARLAAAPLSEVWVRIIRPAPPPHPADPGLAAKYTPRPH